VTQGQSGAVGEASAIRQAGSGDASTLSALAMETYGDAFGRSFRPSDLAAHLARYLSPQQVKQILEEDTVLVAEVGQRMVGFVQFGSASGGAETVSGSDRELRRLYVQADFRNQGIGGRLMEAALAHPDMRDAERITLDVWEHNPGAQRFYERYGFTVIGARRFSVESGAETTLDLIMELHRSGNGWPGYSRFRQPTQDVTGED